MVWSKFPISVLTSCWNARRFFPMWYCSLKAQTQFKIEEIVIVDSESTDGTQEKIMSYDRMWHDPPIHLVSKKCTLGKGRNLAVSKSRSIWLLITDIDNCYDLAKLPRPTSWHEFLVVRDRRFPNAWAVLGPRELFLKYPFADTGGGGSGGGNEDIRFFISAPCRFQRIDGFAGDMKRGSSSPEYTVLPLKNNWRRGGVRHRDMARYVFKLLQSPSCYPDALREIGRLGADLITLGLPGRLPYVPPAI